MATFKTYSISGSFPNHKVDPTMLSEQIQASPITVALDHIDTDGDDCTISFKADLDAADVTALDVVVAAHDGEPPATTVTPVILEPTGDSAKALIIHGRKWLPDLSEDGSVKESTCDIVFAEERALQGIYFMSSGFIDGDSVRIAIVHPATGDELRVLAEGNGEGDGIDIPPSGGVNVTSEGTSVIPAGVPIRFHYWTTQTEEAPKVYIQLRQWV